MAFGFRHQQVRLDVERLAGLEDNNAEFWWQNMYVLYVSIQRLFLTYALACLLFLHCSTSKDSGNKFQNGGLRWVVVWNRTEHSLDDVGWT